jgi:hypothetical protein
MSNLTTKNKADATRIAALEAQLEAQAVTHEGNVYVSMTYDYEGVPMKFGALRVDNTSFISTNLAGWLKLRSDELKAGTTTLEAVNAEFASKVSFDLLRAIVDNDKAASFAQFAPERKKAGSAFTAASRSTVTMPS